MNKNMWYKNCAQRPRQKGCTMYCCLLVINSRWRVWFSLLAHPAKTFLPPYVDSMISIVTEGQLLVARGMINFVSWRRRRYWVVGVGWGTAEWGGIWWKKADTDVDYFLYGLSSKSDNIATYIFLYFIYLSHITVI